VAVDRGEHSAVVSEHRGGQSVQFSGLPERRDYITGLVDRAGGRGDQEPGVIIDDVEDLHAGAAGQLPVSDVHLPALVRQVRAEPHVRRSRPFLRLRGDQAAAAQHPPDRRRRRHLVTALGQVPGDRLRPGIQALPSQLLAQRDDLILDLGGQSGRTRTRPLRPRMQALVPLGPVAAQALIHPAPGDAVRGSNLPDAQALMNNSLHDVADQIRRTPPRRCPRCPATSVRYLMKRSTSRRATLPRSSRPQSAIASQAASRRNTGLVPQTCHSITTYQDRLQPASAMASASARWPSGDECR
jgi:hypothetical protein